MMNEDASEVIKNVEADAIPPVVQRALGMQNLNDPSTSDVIRGLEGFLLPRYLSLRSGHHEQQNNEASSSLPYALIRAQEEEHHRRFRDRKRTSGGARNGKGAIRPRKRKRKAGASHRSKSDNATNTTCGEMLARKQNINQGNTHKDTRQRDRKRRKNTQADVDTPGVESFDKSGSTNWMHYQTIARIIVAPYTSSSIAVVNRCKQMERKRLRTEPEGFGNGHGGKETVSATQRAGPQIAPGASPQAVESSTTTKNIYRKSADGKQTRNKAFLTFSPPKESLENVVDGAICALVRRTHCFRCQSGSKSFGRKIDRNGGAAIPNYRRRRRQKGTQHENLSGSAPNPSVSKDPKRNGSRSSGNNNWLLEQNLLSSGYTLGSGDTLLTYRNAGGVPRRKIRLNQCPNMAPGVHCIQPNAVASYARSSAFMRFLHSVVGDDALREVLLNSVVLVPAAVPSGSSSEPSSASFDRGNYFQLCGPPVNVLAKRFEGMGGPLSATGDRGSSRGKRKRNDTENETSSTAMSASKVLRSISPAKGQGTSESKNDRCNGREEIDRKGRWDPNGIIPRGNLFYCDFYNKRVGLSPRHLLNQCDDAGPLPSVDVKLLNAMVQIWPSIRRNRPGGSGTSLPINCNKRRSRWRRLRKSGVSMCGEMRRRHRQCDYARLLDRHCRLPAKVTARLPSEEFETLDAKETLALHVTLHTPAESVGSFLEAVLRSAFPTAFWGSVHNFRQVVRTVRVFTKLGRTEQLPEKSIVEGIRVLDMTWLLPASRRSESKERRRSLKLSRSDHESATVLVRNVMRWLYRRFIIPLLRSTFYVTETEFTGARVLYYRRPAWSRIKLFSMKLLLRQQYREMNAAKAQKLLSNHNVGCPPAPLRLLPKKTGVRAIAMLSKSCALENSDRGGIKGSAPPNKILQSTFHALKYEHKKNPSLFGAGVLGLTEVFPSFCSFVEALKQKWPNFGSQASAAGPDVSGRNLYFASADIKHCYDTINQKRLYKLIRSVLKEDVYLTKNDFILHSRDDNGSLRCRWRKHTFPPDQFSRFLAIDTFAGRYRQSIFVAGLHCPMEKKETITSLLRDHIFGQVVVANGNHGQRYLLQKDGIPQGSILSSMFCNIYFGNIEGFLLNEVFEKESSYLIRGNAPTECDALFIRSHHDLHLLVRIVDDFLLISTSKQTSVRFLKKLNKGIPSLGVKINSGKSRVNYPTTILNSDTGKMEAVPACENFYFPWCGLLVDTRTCEISLDYQRFSRLQATDTVLIHRAGNEGWNLKKKMKDFVRPRCCQKLLFSSRVNGLGVISLNFYQTFLLCAIKTIHYIQHISGKKSLMHQKFIYSSACDTIQFAFLLISSKIKHEKMKTDTSSAKNDIPFRLLPKDALWLGRHAFFSVFRKFGKQFVELCHLFSESSRMPSRKDLLEVSRQALKMFPLEGFQL